MGAATDLMNWREGSYDSEMGPEEIVALQEDSCRVSGELVADTLMTHWVVFVEGMFVLCEKPELHGRWLVRCGVILMRKYDKGRKIMGIKLWIVPWSW
jgi:hypothetical protein